MHEPKGCVEYTLELEWGCHWQKTQKVWQAGWGLCVFYAQFVRQGIGLFSRMVFFSVQKMKLDFIFLLGPETKYRIQDDPYSLEGFIDWVGL